MVVDDAIPAPRSSRLSLLLSLSHPLFRQSTRCRLAQPSQFAQVLVVRQNAGRD